MSLQLYHTTFSPPSRVVRIIVKQLGINAEEKEVSLLTGEHMKPEFLSINPFHCVPTLVDDGFALWESRSIITYLVDKFAPGNSIYPTELQARAIVNRWLFWDAGTLFSTLGAYFGPIFRGGSAQPEMAELFKKKVAELDSILEKTKYLAGDELTIADITIAVTITTATAVGVDTSELKNVEKWLQQVESDLSASTWKDLVIDPANSLGTFVKAKIASS
ncbi:glutathione S-transferase 1, isoform C-like [Tetranychus urticae]|uniref:Glutathione S-transferase delta/epsilon n=1 Tax=Tetranychus urticae TaxID=32264 RepID=T1PTM6_TETUR|nr:glutathione S-transferase 1, isoform C-like [Tetranychus urticae]AFQ61039.1 glutathione S-transferase delta/epsilon [Tetranychus urticae]